MVELAILAIILVLCVAVVLFAKGLREQFTVSQKEQRKRMVEEYREDQTVFPEVWREDK